MSNSVLSIVFGNIGSKAVGLFREILFAAWFGTGEIAAAFRIAQTGFLMPTHALIGDALSAGLLPLYRNMKEQSSDTSRALVLTASLYGLMFSALVTTLLWLYASSFAAFIAPGANSAALELASALLRIMALATPFYVMSGMLSYLETAYRHYGAIAWRPMLLNVGSIGGAVLAVWLHQDHWLATGILLSHIAFFAWTLLQFSRLDRVLPEQRPAFAVLKQVSGRFFGNILPLLGLPLAAQINVLIERIVSSKIGTEVIPSVDYARFVSDTTVQLIAVPLGILTMSVHGGAAGAEIRAHIGTVMRMILLLAVPIAAFAGLNAEGIVRLLFARGAFDEQSVALTSSVLFWMGGAISLTVPAYYLIKALNAELRNRTALLFTVFACAVNAVVNLSLWPLLGAQTIGIGIVGYGATLLVLCLRAFRLERELLPVVVWILPAAAVQVLAGLAVRDLLHHNWLVELVVNAVIAALLWGGLLLAVPVLRSAASPALARLPLLRRLVR